MSVQLQTQTIPKTTSNPSYTLVSRGLLQRQCACGQHTVVDGECEECRKKRGGTLQRAAVNPAPLSGVPSIVYDVLRSPGQPLDTETRAFMEPRFGHDFSQVRVHTDEKAAESARTVNALAYTVGQDVVFGEGRYAPGTHEGQQLLAHELAHVIQQGRGGAAPPSPLSDTLLEGAADQAASALFQDSGPIHVAGASSPGLARQPGPRKDDLREPSDMEDDELLAARERIWAWLNKSESKGHLDYKKVLDHFVALDNEVVRRGLGRETEAEKEEPEPVKESKAAKRTAPGSSGRFPANTPTKALALWDYVVYKDEVRLGNRVISKDKATGAAQIIGAWPWMTNNPGDLTVDVKPPEKRKQETRAFGLGAMPGVAARTDLAIFPTMKTGEQALRTWIKTYYADLTLADAARKHLGSESSHLPGVDDPVAYAEQLQTCLNKRGLKINVHSKKVADLTPDELTEVGTCFGVVEGVENIGIIYTCSGRDSANDSKLEKWKANHAFVKALPTTLPPEIADLLGCAKP